MRRDFTVKLAIPLQATIDSKSNIIGAIHRINVNIGSSQGHGSGYQIDGWRRLIAR
jgi:hypothetical protein